MAVNIEKRLRRYNRKLKAHRRHANGDDRRKRAVLRARAAR